MRLKFTLENKDEIKLTINKVAHAMMWIDNQYEPGVVPCYGIECHECELNGKGGVGCTIDAGFALADVVKVDDVSHEISDNFSTGFPVLSQSKMHDSMHL